MFDVEALIITNVILRRNLRYLIIWLCQADGTAMLATVEAPTVCPGLCHLTDVSYHCRSFASPAQSPTSWERKEFPL